VVVVAAAAAAVVVVVVVVVVVIKNGVGGWDAEAVREWVGVSSQVN